jgi:hypothetical protein
MKLLICVLVLAVLSGPASALSTMQRNADGGVTIRSSVSQGAVLDPGDPVAFQYQSARNATVIVIDIDTQGYVTLLTDEPVDVTAREMQRLPNDDAELTAGGEPGVEFVFALAVSDPGSIDEDAFHAMRSETRRISGDPFIAANLIAGELLRDVSQQSVFIGYTYFYVSERVEYPCYLCGVCDGSGGSGECDGYRIVQNFDRGTALAYPLARGYEMVETASRPATESVDDTAGSVAIPDEASEVSFYPYGSEVHYADPVAMNLWYTWGWYDPFFWYYPYCYPYSYGSPWHVSIGFGWGWGWGGYYCSGWYDPWYGCGYPSYPYYPTYPYYPDTRPVSKFKSQYKTAGAPSLTGSRSYAAKHDSDLRVASKSLRPAAAKSSWRTRSQSGSAGNPFESTHRVKTSVSGKSGALTRQVWTKGRSSSYRDTPVYRSQRSTVFQPRNNAGKSVMERSGYKTRGGPSVKSPSSAPERRGTTPRTKSGWSAPSKRGVPYSSGSVPAPRMGSFRGSTSAPAMRGWSGGARGTASAGGMRGGAIKGGRSR